MVIIIFNQPRSMACQVVSILGDEVYKSIELVEVVIAEITIKSRASEVIRKMNYSYPIESLQHLKRVKSIDSRLFILVALNNSKSAEELDKEKDTLGIGDLVIVKVPKRRPLTRAQFEVGKQYWPLYFHEDKSLEKMLKSEYFSGDELVTIATFMKLTTCDSCKGHHTAAVIVDPTTNEIVARASSSSSFPLQHAVMRCIDAVAKAQGGGAWKAEGGVARTSGTDTGFHSYQYETDDREIPTQKDQIGIEQCPPPAKRVKLDKPYLCSGYDAYVSVEPCVMCAMALLHSRARRVFFCQQNPRVGGLESNYKIHLHHKLNHHFQVFRVT